MSTVAFARLVREDIETDLKNVEEGILQGAPDFAETRFMAGKRWGLKQALGIVDDVTRRFDETQN